MKLVFLTLIASLFLVGCFSTADLPPITDASRLTKDCDQLMTSVTTLGIPASQWPASIKNLNPQFVRKQEDGIYITTHAETGQGSRGYIVSRQKPKGNPHIAVSATDYPDIYRFDFSP